MDSRICVSVLCTGLPSSKFVSHHEARIKPRHMNSNPGSHMLDGRYPFDPIQIVYNMLQIVCINLCCINMFEPG